MAKGLRFIFILASLLMWLAISAYALWYAWEHGYIKGNPRAISQLAMLEAVKAQASFELRSRQQAQSCLKLDVNFPKVEQKGFPGITYQQLPGQHRIILHHQTATPHQAARELQLKRLNFMAKQGFFKHAIHPVIKNENDLSIQNQAAPGSIIAFDDNASASANELSSSNAAKSQAIVIANQATTQKASHYELTWKGYQQILPNNRHSLCFPLGQFEFLDIISYKKLEGQIIDNDIYEVTYTSQLKNIPQWAQASGVEDVFPELEELLLAKRKTALIVRSPRTWLAHFQVKNQMSSLTKHGIVKKTKNISKQMLESQPPLSSSQARHLINKTMANQRWSTRYGISCLRLNLPRSGDIAIKQKKDEAFKLIFEDNQKRRNYRYQELINKLSILEALRHAKLSELTVLDKDPQQIEFSISADMKKQLNLKYSGGCLPLGALKIKDISLTKYNKGYRLAALAQISPATPWAKALQSQIPALASILETGLIYHGDIKAQSSESSFKWKLTNFKPAYPNTRYDHFPSTLISLMPNSYREYQQYKNK